MNADRKTAIVVGVLFIVATAFLFIGRAVYDPILGSPDYLELAYPQRTRVIIGMLLEFMIVLAIPLIAVFFFPILRKFNEALAIGYVVFRSLEAVVLISVAEINKLSLIGVSQDFLNSEGVDASLFQYLGSAIRAETVWGDASGLLYVPLFVVGALMLYAVLLQSRLVPQWLSVWGLIAAVLILAGVVLSPFMDFPLALELLVTVPIAVQEMVMALWLIFRGLNPAAIASQSA